MGHFLDIAYRILSEEGRPLTAREITTRASQVGLLHTQGKTPWQTMKAKLSTEILRKKDRSPFMRTEQGRFALREWKVQRFDEYVAGRYTRALLEEEVVVFPAPSLTRYVPHPGLISNPLKNSRALLDECFPMLRRIAEEDFSVIQLVSVFIVHFGDLYLTYKRARRLPENRLHGSYSMIFGGHLNPEDIPSLFDIFNPMDGPAFIARELQEEIILPREEQPELVYRGLLYDDSRELSKQHLGVVYDVKLHSTNYEIGERGFLIDSKLETLEQIAVRRASFENWSVLILDEELRARKME